MIEINMIGKGSYRMRRHYEDKSRWVHWLGDSILGKFLLNGLI